MLCMAAAGPAGLVAQGAEERAVERLADRYFDAWVERNPEVATFQQIDGAPLDRLSDNGPEALERWQAFEDEMLSELAAIDRSALAGSTSEVTHAYLLDALERSVAGRVCRAQLWGLNHIAGWQTALPVVASAQPVGSPAARSAALARLRDTPRFIDQEIRNLRRGLDLGYAQPATVVDRVRQQIEGLAAQPPAASAFLDPIRRDEHTAFADTARMIYETGIVPALERFAGFLEHDYRPRARTTAGIHSFPEGEACYRAAVRQFTTLDEDPARLYERGLAVLRELTEARDALAAELGYPSAEAAIQAAEALPENRFSTRQDMLDYTESLVERARGVAPQWFNRMPETPLVVESFPEFQERTAPGGQYMPGLADGSRPGVYMLNTLNPQSKDKVGLETLTWHEAIPGHHFQLALALERPESHPVSRYLFNSGFAEGWGLYAELLADEMGLFSTDAQRLAMYNSLRFRAVRLVVDPAMHALGWSRDDVLDFFEREMGFSREGIANEVDRYIAWPGQATSYLTGMLVIRELRAEAESALGEAFDVRAFHDWVLEDGSVPVEYLRRKVRSRASER